MTTIGSYAPDFEIPGIDGSVHHLRQYLQQYRAVCVVFMCNHCPYVKRYLERLKQIHAEFQEQGCTLVGINPNDEDRFPEDSFENMKVFAMEQGLNFPYLRDVTQDVAHSFGASRTPEVFLIDHAGVIQYTGAIDDNQDAGAVTAPYLREAIANLLSGTPIRADNPGAIGCSVKWRT